MDFFDEFSSRALCPSEMAPWLSLWLTFSTNDIIQNGYSFIYKTNKNWILKPDMAIIRDMQRIVSHNSRNIKVHYIKSIFLPTTANSESKEKSRILFSVLYITQTWLCS